MNAILRSRTQITAEQSSPSRLRVCVLFVCVANSCRSQMAEAFAIRYGSDVLRAESAGIRPAPRVSTTTRKVMREKDLTVPDQPPKGFGRFNLEEFDLIVNLSGLALPYSGSLPVLNLSVPDPAGRDEEFVREVRDRIEFQVQRLAQDLRSACLKYMQPSTFSQAAPHLRRAAYY